ncbi:uncharacterized protein [Littorina saxatilis]|uniref:Uncharacterized protein n=1 Tax=Littorina saxatilis TaxID=31220 RepID=A0AAN9AQU8_9CAEN
MLRLVLLCSLAAALTLLADAQGYRCSQRRSRRIRKKHPPPPPPCGQTSILFDESFSLVSFIFLNNGYPRNMNPRVLTVMTDESVSKTNLKKNGLKIVFRNFDVPCPDTVTVFEDTIDPANVILPPTCNDNSTCIDNSTSILTNQLTTFTNKLLIRLDLAKHGTSGSGFSFGAFI